MGFIEFNDGTFLGVNLYNSKLRKFEDIQKLRIGGAITVGTVIESPREEQPFEIAVKNYFRRRLSRWLSIQPKRHTREFLKRANI